MARQVLVVGSGAAGLTAALAAAHAGAQVTVLERADTLGGTTALSGGLAWLPANRHMAAAGVDDSPAAAREYLAQLSLGDVDTQKLDRFADQAPDVADWLESVSPLCWQSVPYPDYHAELPGGRPGHRPLEPQPYRAPAAVSRLVREAPNVTAPVTYLELAGGTADRTVVAERAAAGVLTLGRALVACLAEAALAAGVEIRTGTAVQALQRSDWAVTGVTTSDGTHHRGRVILASGGFERNPDMVRTFLRGPMLAPTGAPPADGTALRLAMAAGAELGNMSEAWWCPAMSIPGESIDGSPFHRLLLTERARPGAILVNATAQRFTNEAQNYNDVGRVMQNFDASAFRYPNAEAFLVFDAAYRRRYHFGPLRRDDPDPSWLYRAEDLSQLAKVLGLDGEQLQQTVQTFNLTAEAGRDPAWQRGDFPYDRFVGDPAAPHPTLGTLNEPPYYAVRVQPGCLGTKGGPRTDLSGQVRHRDGGLVEGLFAAGNAAASFLGLAYPGAGGTIGPMLVEARAAGAAAAA